MPVSFKEISLVKRPNDNIRTDVSPRIFTLFSICKLQLCVKLPRILVTTVGSRIMGVMLAQWLPLSKKKISLVKTKKMLFKPMYLLEFSLFSQSITAITCKIIWNTSPNHRITHHGSHVDKNISKSHFRVFCARFHIFCANYASPVLTCSIFRHSSMRSSILISWARDSEHK